MGRSEWNFNKLELFVSEHLPFFDDPKLFVKVYFLFAVTKVVRMGIELMIRKTWVQVYGER